MNNYGFVISNNQYVVDRFYTGDIRRELPEVFIYDGWSMHIANLVQVEQNVSETIRQEKFGKTSDLFDNHNSDDIYNCHDGNSNNEDDSDDSDNSDDSDDSDKSDESDIDDSHSDDTDDITHEWGYPERDYYAEDNSIRRCGDCYNPHSDGHNNYGQKFEHECPCSNCRSTFDNRRKCKCASVVAMTKLLEQHKSNKRKHVDCVGVETPCDIVVKKIRKMIKIASNCDQYRYKDFEQRLNKISKCIV